MSEEDCHLPLNGIMCNLGNKNMELTKEQRLAEMQEKLRCFLSVPGNADVAAQNAAVDLIDDAILGVIFEVHRSAKLGYLSLEEGLEQEGGYKIVDDPNLDIFGQSPIKKQEDYCSCPSCNCNLAASRFAPHLAKCLGMGRTSYRIASRRIANSSKENAYSGLLSDDDDDADGSDKRCKKRNRNGSKKSKNQKVKNGDVASHDANSLSNATLNYENMSNEDKKQLLTQICGVISKHTKKLCTRSLRCPQHTDDQRRAVRYTLLSDSTSVLDESACSNTSMTENVQVDVDTYEEGDGQVVRESLGKTWEQEHSSNSSPADSTSTSMSSSSKKCEKSSKSKKKGSPKGYKLAGTSFQGSHIQPMVE